MPACQVFSSSLRDRIGFNVAGKIFGFMETHQIWVLIGTEQQAWGACAKLHRAGIRAYPANLPFVNTWGLRLGTNAITRLGFSTNKLQQVAQWMGDILLNNALPENIFKQVKQLMNGFPIHDVKYALHNNDSILCR